MLIFFLLMKYFITYVLCLRKIRRNCDMKLVKNNHGSMTETMKAEEPYDSD